ncbi:hypothetical protein C7M84_012382 [Penaeus vannamei]|uniref:Uncharacterized protein n=1 Tax=Penaeus vannamei TaxID=6689 RepID=A0A3R7NXE9_PENVA|nr:hypothetical protein C7M84_012382 [Penaeus vannamei]
MHSPKSLSPLLLPTSFSASLLTPYTLIFVFLLHLLSLSLIISLVLPSLTSPLFLAFMLSFSLSLASPLLSLSHFLFFLFSLFLSSLFSSSLPFFFFVFLLSPFLSSLFSFSLPFFLSRFPLISLSLFLAFSSSPFLSSSLSSPLSFSHPRFSLFSLLFLSLSSPPATFSLLLPRFLTHYPPPPHPLPTPLLTPSPHPSSPPPHTPPHPLPTPLLTPSPLLPSPHPLPTPSALPPSLWRQDRRGRGTWWGIPGVIFKGLVGQASVSAIASTKGGSLERIKETHPYSFPEVAKGACGFLLHGLLPPSTGLVGGVLHPTSASHRREGESATAQPPDESRSTKLEPQRHNQAPKRPVKTGWLGCDGCSNYVITRYNVSPSPPHLLLTSLPAPHPSSSLRILETNTDPARLINLLRPRLTAAHNPVSGRQ